MTGKRPSLRRAMRIQTTTGHSALPWVPGGLSVTENTQCGFIKDKLGLTNLNALDDDWLSGHRESKICLL